MKNIRIGNDIWFKWQILREEGVETWDGKDIKVTLRDSYGMECAVDWRKDEGGVISGVCRGRAQKRLGLYTLTLTENDGKDNMGCVDSIDAWRLVARQNASIADEEERDGALGVEVVKLTSKVGIGTGEGITIDTELNEESGNAIANSAVTKGINAVGEISEQDLQEVVGVSAGTGGDVPSTKPKKKREQIIIGKAIRLKSCEVTDAENWYVKNHKNISNDNFKVLIPWEYEGCNWTVYLRNKEGEYEETEGYSKVGYDRTNEEVYCEVGRFLYEWPVCAWRVDRYEVDKQSKKGKVWMTFKMMPLTFKGMGMRYEYRNGRMVWNHTLSIYDLRKERLDTILYRRERKIYDIYKWQRWRKNKRWRKNLIENKEPGRDRKLRWAKKAYDSEGGWLAANNSGLYRIVEKDKTSGKKVYLNFYYNQDSHSIKKT